MKGTRAMTNTLRFLASSSLVIPPPPPASPRRGVGLAPLFCIAVILSSALVTGGCVSSDPGDFGSSEPVVSSAPEWRFQPHSWERLQAIEDWLLGSGPDLYPGLAMEAELLLAEGRLRFARSEMSITSEAVVANRLSSAERGFRRVLECALSDPALHRRARAGLDDVRDLRQDPGGPALTGLIPRSGWGARTPDQSNLTANRARYSRITVHHTAMSTSNLGRGSAAEAAQAVQGIQRQHMSGRGYGDIGYHFVIDPSGRTYAARSLAWQGAHARGSNNVGNIGICLLGNFEAERPTSRALDALNSLIEELRGRYHVSRTQIYGHRDFTATACPGRHLMTWVQRYKSGLLAASAPR